MSDPIHLSAEAWAAIALLGTPLIAAMAANIQLTSVVRNLTKEMHELKNTLHVRLLRLELSTQKKTRKPAMTKKKK